MPEPLSITTGVLTLLRVTWSVGCELKKFRDGVAVVCRSIDVLVQDVEGLTVVLESMRDTCEAITAANGSDHMSSHWENIARFLEGANGVLGELRTETEDINKPASFLEGPRKQLRLNLAADRIMGYRTQIQSYRDGLQLSLQTIIIHNQMAHKQAPKIDIPSLTDLSKDVRRIVKDVSEVREALSANAQSHEDEAKITAIDDLRECIKSAASIVSSASTVTGYDAGLQRSNTVVNSDFGDCFPVKEKEVVRRWIESRSVAEYEPEDLLAVPLSVADVPLLDEDEDSEDSDGELEDEMTAVLLESGQQKLAAGDWTDAERLFKKCLPRLACSSPNYRSDHTLGQVAKQVEILESLFWLYDRQQRWTDAEEVVRSKINLRERAGQRADWQYFADVLTLARLYFRQGNLAQALSHARRALKGYRKLRSTSDIRTCLLLLVDICKSGPNQDDGETYAMMLSKIHHDQTSAPANFSELPPATVVDDDSLHASQQSHQTVAMDQRMQGATPNHANVQEKPSTVTEDPPSILRKVHKTDRDLIPFKTPEGKRGSHVQARLFEHLPGVSMEPRQRDEHDSSSQQCQPTDQLTRDRQLLLLPEPHDGGDIGHKRAASSHNSLSARIVEREINRETNVSDEKSTETKDTGSEVEAPLTPSPLAEYNEEGRPKRLENLADAHESAFDGIASMLTQGSREGFYNNVGLGIDAGEDEAADWRNEKEVAYTPDDKNHRRALSSPMEAHLIDDPIVPKTDVQTNGQQKPPRSDSLRRSNFRSSLTSSATSDCEPYITASEIGSPTSTAGTTLSASSSPGQNISKTYRSRRAEPRPSDVGMSENRVEGDPLPKSLRLVPPKKLHGNLEVSPRRSWTQEQTDYELSLTGEASTKAASSAQTVSEATASLQAKTFDDTETLNTPELNSLTLATVSGGSQRDDALSDSSNGLPWGWSVASLDGSGDGPSHGQQHRQREAAIGKHKSSTIILFGDGLCGKSSLLDKFVTKGFTENSSLDLGYHLTTVTCEVDDQIVVSEIIVVSGQEDGGRALFATSETNKCFLACFAIDFPTSLENLSDKWLPQLQPGKTPILLVGCKGEYRDSPGTVKSYGDIRQRLITLKECEDARKKLGAFEYLECSSKTGDGVEAVFRAAIKASLATKPNRKRSRFRMF